MDNRIERIIREEINKVVNEGIDIDKYNLSVSYNPSHEDNVETSEVTNPTMVTKYAPNVEVWSIFKRKVGSTNDGNPLVYAMKGERGWKFKTTRDMNAIYGQIEKIANKFFQNYQSDVTVVVPSQGVLNEVIGNLAKKHNSAALFIDNLFLKLTCEEVLEIILLPNSMFRRVFRNAEDFENAYNTLEKLYMPKMGKYYRSHFVKDESIRTAVDQTIRIAEERVGNYMDAINNKNILVLDDNVGYGSTIGQICKLLRQYYSPATITALTLFSEKYDKNGRQIQRKRGILKR